MELANFYEVESRPSMSAQPQQHAAYGYREPPASTGDVTELCDNENSIDISAYIDPAAFNDEFLADLFHNSKQDRAKATMDYQQGHPSMYGCMATYLDSKMDNGLRPLDNATQHPTNQRPSRLHPANQPAPILPAPHQPAPISPVHFQPAPIPPAPR